VFRAEIPGDLDPRMWIDGDLLVVVDDLPQRETTIALDHGGRRRFALSEAVFGAFGELGEGRPLFHRLPGGDLLFASTKRVARVDPVGHVRWERAAPRETFVAQNQYLDLPGGDVLLANSGFIADSGVHLLRLRPSDGATVWKADVRGLDVPHSTYEHVAYAEARADDLFVVSQGSSGSFFERIALATGARELRCVLDESGPACSRP
jgi:hypothetical protein